MWVRVEVWDEGPILNTFPTNLEDECNLKKQIRKKKKERKKQIRKSREGTCGTWQCLEDNGLIEVSVKC